MNAKRLFAVLFLLAAAGVIPASAQNRVCALSLSVVEFKTETPVKGAAARATNVDSKKVYQAILFKNQMTFTSVPEGSYLLSVTKAGYKRTTREIFLNCGIAELNGSQTEEVVLQKGSAKLTYRMPKPPPPRLQGTIVVGEYDSNSPVEKETAKTVDASDGRPMTVTESPSSSRPSPKMISGGVVNSKATNLVRPPYPVAARAVRASGAVNVQVTIDEQGNVISATAVSGHPLLRVAAEKAARESKFSPTLLEGFPVKVTGVIVYNFVP